MLQSLLLILWLVFGIIAVSGLFYKNHYDNQILGVTLSPEHAQFPEVEEIVKRFQKACYAVLLLSIGLSLLMLAQMFGAYAEFYMVVLVMVNFFANWFIIHRYQQKLLALKKEKAWTYPRKRVVAVDLNVAKEKGSSSLSAVWSWLFLGLSFGPAVFLMLYPESQAFYPIGFSLIGPLCQLGPIYLYYQMRTRHTPALSDNTEINKACARTEERVNTMAATLSALALLTFWILLNISIVYLKNGLAVALAAFILVVALLIIANWQQGKIRAVENRFFGAISAGGGDIFETGSTWKWGCYYNPSDYRIIVPKRMASMGWTLNIGRPAGKAIGLGMLVSLLVLTGIIGAVLYGGSKDYRITANGSAIMIDAAMYDLTLEKDQVVSVSTIDDIPAGIRTNGYGGVNKSFGHFAIDGYGKCMLYVYNQVDKYIVLQLAGNDPGYVIVNDKSPEKTEQLYQTIRQWLDE